MINIVTPTTRVENLQAIADSLKGNHQIRWWIVLDPIANIDKMNFTHPDNVEVMVHQNDFRAIAGHLHRNYVLNRIKDDEWFYSVDDDNILHPGFLDELTEDRSAIIVSQMEKDGSPRLVADYPRVSNIDTAQYAFRKSIIGHTRFENIYEGDGYFSEDVYRKFPNMFVLINNYLCWYNYLK